MAIFIEVTLYNSGATIPVNVNAIKAMIPKSDSTERSPTKAVFTKIVTDGIEGGYNIRESIETIMQKIENVQGSPPLYIPEQKESNEEEGETDGVMPPGGVEDLDTGEV